MILVTIEVIVNDAYLESLGEAEELITELVDSKFDENEAVSSYDITKVERQ